MEPKIIVVFGRIGAISIIQGSPFAVDVTHNGHALDSQLGNLQVLKKLCSLCTMWRYYMWFVMSRWVKDQLGHGTPRKQNVERERAVFNHKNPTPNVTYLQKRESETLYPYYCVRNIFTYPKSKALGQALAHKPRLLSNTLKTASKTIIKESRDLEKWINFMLFLENRLTHYWNIQTFTCSHHILLVSQKPCNYS
jgi:hypothetical protein